MTYDNEGRANEPPQAPGGPDANTISASDNRLAKSCHLPKKIVLIVAIFFFDWL